MNETQETKKRGSTKWSSKSRGKGSNTDKAHRANKRDNGSCPNGVAMAEPVTKNDWQFYAPSEQIAKDVASIPFNYMGGTVFPLEVKPYSNAGVPNSSEGKAIDGIPAVMKLEYLPTIGTSKTVANNGINMAAAQLYTKIRKNNSGAKNYEAPDVMMYILAMRDIYANYFQARKIIGLVNLFDYYNHNLPTSLLLSMGLTNIDDLRGNIANYRARLNLIARQINSFAVPSYFKIFDRTVFVNSYVFTDSSSIRGQFYNFYKRLNYKWSGTASQTGTSLVLDETFNEGSFDTYLNNLTTQINAIFYDEDALTMSGDIAKAFDSLYTVQEVGDDYLSPFKYDEDVLAQIENAAFPRLSRSNNVITATLDADVKQANQLITFEPKFIMNQLSSTSDYLFSLETYGFNSHKDNPDFRDVLEWTRLMSAWSYKSVDDNKIECTIETCGFELLYNVEIMVPTFESGSQAYRNYPVEQFALDGINTSHTHFLINTFDWHPMLYLIRKSATGIVKYYPMLVGDTKVVTTVSKKIVDTINAAAVYGGLQGIGK